METGKLKKFATDARTNLMDGVRLKLRRLGFDERGHAVKAPELISGGTIWNGEEYPEEFHAQWMALRDLLLKRGVREVVETAAYTWFNRMVAIRILTKNNLCDSILGIDDMTGIPRLLAEARMGRVPEMPVQQRRRFQWLMNDDNRTADQFAVLLTAWCHANQVINSCFGSIDDFVEILLPDNILKDSGFLSLLNHTEFITDDDYKSAELIGWLYQFYISDRKDEVFAKKGKVEADEIPAATQIFTPNWIVKYMVQNTIIPQVDAPEEVVEECKYLVKAEGGESRKVELEEMKVADFACGSGHILNECFDLLYELYKAEAYSRREAVECIFTKNLLGIDIDLRAKQLATFALLLKACQKDPAFADAHCMPSVLTVPEFTTILKSSKYEDEDGGHGKHIKHVFFQDAVTDEVACELENAFTLLKDADSLGSIIKFNLSDSALRAIKDTTEYWQSKDVANRPEFVNDLLPAIDFIIALTNSYDTIVMNPPYMGQNKMDLILSDYVNDNYPDSRSDLMTVFMDVCMLHTKVGGYWSMINLPSWMFLNSFENIRKSLIKSQQIIALNQNGRGLFGADFGSVTFVVKNERPSINGIYRRLYKKHVQVRNIDTIKDLYLDKSYGLYKANQRDFIKVPGSPISYWMTDALMEAFSESKVLNYGNAKKGLSTGDNDTFLRLWFEINLKKVIFNANNFNNDAKWYPINKGGSFRLWYGNNEYVINWANNGEDIKNFKGSVIRNSQYYLRESLTWTMLSSSTFGIRYSAKGKIFEGAGPSLFINKDNDIAYIQGVLTSKVGNFILKSLNPTINMNIVDIMNFPIIENVNVRPSIENLVECNRLISKQDWDAHETSWDFQMNPLVFSIYDNGWGKFEHSVEDYEQTWEHRFKQLHANEEELNRQFIEIYGLQDELTPDVPLDEVTILQQGEVKIEDGKLVWQRDVIIKQLISYIVGCYMGRYRLDRVHETGLHIAHPDSSDEELQPYSISFTHDETFTIDADAIIPVLPADAPFHDNLRNYVTEFISKVWEADDLTENINFIEKCLGKSLDDFLIKDFWKYHKKMYQNRPIYWEFASKKGAFRAIVYAHRMDRYTVEVLRSKYLLPYIGHIRRKIAALEIRQNELTTAERRELDTLRAKTLPELEEYHKRVEKVAAESAARTTVFDLDDGIVKNHALFGDIVTKLK